MRFLKYAIGVFLWCGWLTAHAGPPAGYQWVQTFSDDFNGTALDTSKWTNVNNDKANRYNTANVSFANGYMTMRTTKNASGLLQGARIDTRFLEDNRSKFSQLYGYFETRAEVNNSYVALWLHHYPGMFRVDKTGHDGTEIDVMETMYYGRESFSNNLHYDNYAEPAHEHRGSPEHSAPGLRTGFHTFGLEWDPQYLKFYYDGKLVWTYQGVAIPLVKEFMILSVENHNWTCPTTGCMARFDYMKVWQRTDRPVPQALTFGSMGQVIRPSDDTYVREGTYAGQNFGQQTTLEVKADADPNYRRKVYMKFSYPTYAYTTVKQAKLRLFVKSVSTDPSRTVRVFATLNKAWYETSLTATGPVSPDIYLGALNITSAGKYYELDLTRYVNQLLASSAADKRTLSLALWNEADGTPGSGVAFTSSEDTVNRPELNLISPTGSTTTPNPTYLANINPSADSSVRDGTYATTNYGTSTLLETKADPLVGYNRKSYLTFNFSSVTQAYSAAKLRLTLASVGADASRTIKVYAVTVKNWSETGINYNNAPAKSTFLGNLVVGKTVGSVYELDVTNFLKQSVPDKILSIVIVNEGTKSAGAAANFGSRQAGSGKPELRFLP
ncbi:MAG: DNRLRE domain-containing protein [Pseudobdellovibrionaceae bacterium]